MQVSKPVPISHPKPAKPATLAVSDQRRKELLAMILRNEAARRDKPR